MDLTKPDEARRISWNSDNQRAAASIFSDGSYAEMMTYIHIGAAGHIYEPPVEVKHNTGGMLRLFDVVVASEHSLVY